MTTPLTEAARAKLSLTLLAPGEGAQIEGRVCEDANQDGRCQEDEAGVPGISVWSEDGLSVAVSDEDGYFVLRAQSEYLRVVAPNGYRGGGKLLARPNTEVALAIATPPPSSSGLLADLVGLAPLYGLLAALIGAVTLGNFRLSGALSALKRQQRLSAEWARQAEIYQHRQAIEAHLDKEGPNALAAQIISDALREALGSDLFVVGLSPSPAPHMIFEGAGRRFVLTVNPRALRKARVLRRWSPAASLAESGALANLEAQVLWERMVAQAGLAERPVTPRGAEWYVVIEHGHAR